MNRLLGGMGTAAIHVCREPQQGEMRMVKISLAGFKDPARRPRYIIWTGVAVLLIAAVMIPVLGVTSTRWFCAEGCHKVQDDTIAAYQRSTHAEISCMSCHMPVNANPVIFILHKAEALGELYLTVRDDYELPLNGESEVALTMASKQCTQCHNMENRTPTPSQGIKIDHAVHAEVNAACPVCHNRIAHNESGDWEPQLNDPKSGEKSVKHTDFMSMTACFRCHGLEKGAAAPGTCSACHPADFELKPPSHREKDFYPKGHAEMAREELAKEQEAAGKGGSGEEAPATEESTKTSLLSVDEAYASGGEAKAAVSKEQVPEVLEAQKEEGPSQNESVGEELPSVESINYCSTCHVKTFCSNCHGMDMPHPAEFKEPKDPKDPAGHPAVSKAQPKKCEMCHTKADPQFCNKCHHGEKAGGWKYDTSVPWTKKQHPDAVKAGGVKACTTTCHSVKFCLDCHTGRKVVPSSHKASTWTRPKPPGALTVYGQQPAKPSAGHSTEALKSIESCGVCHGTGGPNAKFCKSCHKLEMPHAASFKTNHVSSKRNPASCTQCHRFKEICSNCHHLGSSLSKPWVQVHGGSVNKNGAASCVEKCHPNKDDCVKCHNARKAKPASHKKAGFVRNYSSKDAQHVALYKKDGENCTYCHKGDVAALPNSKFCNGCHKTEMPHPSGFGPAEGEKPTAENGGQHAQLFQKKKISRAVCANCHQTSFCNSCHHQGASATKPWVRYHPNVVEKSGAEPCFECHKETFCSDCHVNRAADIIKSGR